MAEKVISILYVDDEMINLLSFRAVYRSKYNIFTAISGAEGLEILDKNEIHIVITDQRMPNMTGVEFLEKVIETHPAPIRILLTGYTDMSAIIAAVNKGNIYHYLNKPWDDKEMSRIIEEAYDVYLKKIEIMNENKELSITNSQLEFLLRQKLLS
ncbi:response regulator [Albibacterium bauzanense]|uniref:Response regulator receiver domain-containing protein n=1 Tax=Albibacterium bauzanense TaxID=653929 RepID=A0A4R1M6T6_9SPHI|nr:response regulator [Albibacterium bauzanense]TCK85393.1 response regulator receiver domain-containing protein [Albibacterium bauzanense]